VNQKIVVLATGVALCIEAVNAEEEMPHTHIETAADVSGEVMVIESGGLLQGDGHSHAEHVMFTLKLQSAAYPSFPLIKAGTQEPQNRYEAQFERRKVVQKTGTPVSDSAVRRVSTSFHFASVKPMFGEEDFDHLADSLRDTLHLPTQQIETIVMALKNDHSVEIGNDTTYDDPVLAGFQVWNPPSLVACDERFRQVAEKSLSSILADPPASIVPVMPTRSLRHFSYEELAAFGMKEQLV
jgi:hypothetical protein